MAAQAHGHPAPRVTLSIRNFRQRSGGLRWAQPGPLAPHHTLSSPPALGLWPGSTPRLVARREATLAQGSRTALAAAHCAATRVRMRHACTRCTCGTRGCMRYARYTSCSTTRVRSQLGVGLLHKGDEDGDVVHLAAEVRQAVLRGGAGRMGSTGTPVLSHTRMRGYKRVKAKRAARRATR